MHGWMCAPHIDARICVREWSIRGFVSRVCCVFVTAFVPNLTKLKGQCTNCSIVRTTLKSRKNCLTPYCKLTNNFLHWKLGHFTLQRFKGHRPYISEETRMQSLLIADYQSSWEEKTNKTACQEQSGTLSIFCSSSFRQKIIPPLGPRSVLCVVVVTTSA